MAFQSASVAPKPITGAEAGTGVRTDVGGVGGGVTGVADGGGEGATEGSNDGLGEEEAEESIWLEGGAVGVVRPAA